MRRRCAYLRLTGRPEALVQLVEAYCKEQGLFHTAATPEAIYSDTLALDLGTVEPSLAGPSGRRIACAWSDVKKSFVDALPELLAKAKPKAGAAARAERQRRGNDHPAMAAVAAAEARLGRHRRHHQLHEHVESVGDDGRRPAGQESGRARAARPSRG